MTIIGGGDGPTSIFLAGKAGWLNLFGLIILALLLVPNIVYAITHRGEGAPDAPRAIEILEQIGRYACMLLMVFNIGVAELGFRSPASFAVYLVGNILLMLLYWAFWAVLFVRPHGRGYVRILLAVLPAMIFLLCGVTQRHWLLTGFAVLFAAAHIYITALGVREDGNTR